MSPFIFATPETNFENGSLFSFFLFFFGRSINAWLKEPCLLRTGLALVNPVNLPTAEAAGGTLGLMQDMKRLDASGSFVVPHSASWHPVSNLRAKTELTECARSRSTPDDLEEFQDDDPEDSDCSLSEENAEPTDEDDAKVPIVADSSGWEGFENCPEYCVSFLKFLPKPPRADHYSLLLLRQPTCLFLFGTLCRRTSPVCSGITCVLGGAGRKTLFRPFSFSPLTLDFIYQIPWHSTDGGTNGWVPRSFRLRI